MREGEGVGEEGEDVRWDGIHVLVRRRWEGDVSEEGEDVRWEGDVCEEGEDVRWEGDVSEEGEDVRWEGIHVLVRRERM